MRTTDLPRVGATLGRVVAYVRSRTDAPIWLVGTSQGANAAANGAARLNHGEIAGVVLTSSLSRPGSYSGETVFGATLAAVNVPALVVAHQADTCRYTPPPDAQAIVAPLTGTPKTELMLFDGGSTP